MTLFNAANTPPQQIVAQVVTALLRFRQGIEVGPNLYAWSSSVSLGDLMAPQPDGPGFSQADAQAILDACADAWGLSERFRTGTDPRNPPGDYPYGNSIQRVIAGRVI